MYFICNSQYRYFIIKNIKDNITNLWNTVSIMDRHHLIKQMTRFEHIDQDLPFTHQGLVSWRWKNRFQTYRPVWCRESHWPPQGRNDSIQQLEMSLQVRGCMIIYLNICMVNVFNVHNNQLMMFSTWIMYFSGRSFNHNKYLLNYSL